MDEDFSFGFFCGLVLMAIVWITCWFTFPNMKVYLAERDGKAVLAEAEYSRQIKIKEANATYESSKLLAQAEIEHAKGIAEANKIIGDGLKNNENYLRYLYISSMKETQNQVIYIPTEAGLPILEASRKK